MKAILKVIKKYNLNQILKNLELCFENSLLETIKYIIKNSINTVEPYIFQILLKENYKADYDKLVFNGDNFNFKDFYGICKYLSLKKIYKFEKYERLFLKFKELRCLIKWIKKNNELDYIENIFYFDVPDFIIHYKNKILGLEISSIYYQNTTSKHKEYEVNLLLPIKKLNDFAQKNGIESLESMNRKNTFISIHSIYKEPNLLSFKNHINFKKIDSYYNNIKNKYVQKNKIDLELFFYIDEYAGEIHIDELERKKINEGITSILENLGSEKSFKICIYYEYSDMLIYC